MGLAFQRPVTIGTDPRRDPSPRLLVARGHQAMHLRARITRQAAGRAGRSASPAAKDRSNTTRCAVPTPPRRFPRETQSRGPRLPMPGCRQNTRRSFPRAVSLIRRCPRLPVFTAKGAALRISIRAGTRPPVTTSAFRDLLQFERLFRGPGKRQAERGIGRRGAADLHAVLGHDKGPFAEPGGTAEQGLAARGNVRRLTILHVALGNRRLRHGKPKAVKFAGKPGVLSAPESWHELPFAGDVAQPSHGPVWIRRRPPSPRVGPRTCRYRPPARASSGRDPGSGCVRRPSLGQSPGRAACGACCARRSSWIAIFFK